MEIKKEETNKYKQTISDHRDREREIQDEEIKELIVKPQYTGKMSGNLTDLISKGMSDNKQMTFFTSENGITYYGESYNYKDKNTKLNALYRQQDPINALSADIKQKFEKLVNDKVILSKDIDIFTKKLFHYIHVIAFIQWHSKGYNKYNINNILAKDLQIEIDKKDIQAKFEVSKQYVNKNITTAIYTLRCIEILEFTTKRRDKGQIITGGNDIKKLFTDFDTTKPSKAQITFSLEYAKYLFNYGFIQYPFKIFACNSQIAFDILEYIYRYYFLHNQKNNFNITRKLILENVKSIPSFKDVEERFNRKYKEKIYNPFNDAMAYINENYCNLLQIEPIFTKEEKQEQDKGINEEDKKVNKEEWAKRKLKITLIDPPNYGEKQEKSRKKYNNQK